MRRSFPKAAGRGAYTIRALPDLCRGIVLKRLAAARLNLVTFKPRHVRGFLLCWRYSGRGGLRGTLCARAALPQYGGDMETDHEKAQYARDYRWSRVVDCDALLASMVAKECGALP